MSKAGKQTENDHLFKLTVRCISNCYPINKNTEQCAKCPVVHVCIILRKRKEESQCQKDQANLKTSNN